jgi:hypothetical protein
MRHHPKLDANQPAIVTGLRQMGCSVQSIASVGGGCPDILVGWHGCNVLMEIKDGSKPKGQRKLTHDEQYWHDNWNGQKAVVESLDEAIALMKRYIGA